MSEEDAKALAVELTDCYLKCQAVLEQVEAQIILSKYWLQKLGVARFRFRTFAATYIWSAFIILVFCEYVGK